MQIKIPTTHTLMHIDLRDHAVLQTSSYQSRPGQSGPRVEALTALSALNDECVRFRDVSGHNSPAERFMFGLDLVQASLSRPCGVGNTKPYRCAFTCLFFSS